MRAVVAVDAGTTGVRSIAFDERGEVVASSHRVLTQHFPAPGLVEHDPAEITALVAETLADVARDLAASRHRLPVAAVGITNQRETAVAWDRSTGAVLHPAIVWQDRRTAPRCRELEQAGHLPLVRRLTGLVLDPYFSATKWEWMMNAVGQDGAARLAVGQDGPGRLALGTVDSWVVWNLTGGAGGGAFVTDPSNASRTLCYDIRARAWSQELCALFGLDIGALADVRPSCGRIATVEASAAGGAFAGVPVSGIAGDQQASLFGHGCHARGDAKVTHGTGSFLLANVGDVPPDPVAGLLTTVAWDLGEQAPAGGRRVSYALEGPIFSTGSTIDWLCDGLGVASGPEEVGGLAAAVKRNDGVYFVPALAGLGAPYWDPDARGTVVGLTRGAGRGHIARAALESVAYQLRDVVEAIVAGGCDPIARLRADGGVSRMDLALQLQADQLRIDVERAATTEVTALGAAALAGLAEGVWGSLQEVAGLAGVAERFSPLASQRRADGDHRGWRRAVEQARAFAAVPVSVP